MSKLFKRLKAALQDAIAYKKGALFLPTESIQITHQSHQSKPKKSKRYPN